MFSLDKTLVGIEAAEMDVAEVYRSSMSLNLSVEGLESNPCEAFACAVRAAGSDTTEIFAVLRFPSKFSLVYRSDRKVGSQSDHAAVMKEALEFLGSMGFALEPVNLNYSRAMREVVVRSLRLVSAPGSLEGRRHPLAKKTKTSMGKGADAPVRGAALAAGKSVPEVASPAVDVPLDDAQGERQELARLQAEMAELNDAHAEECAALAVARDRATEGQTALQQRLDAVSTELATVRRAHEEEMASLTREREQSSGVSAEAYARMEHELYEAEGEKERLSAELAAMEKAYAQELDEMRRELEQRTAGKEALRLTLTGECDSLQVKLNTLAAEKQATEKMLADQLAAARSESEALVADLTALRGGQEQELAGLAAEWDRLLLEKSVEHDQLAGELARAHAEVERLQRSQVSADEVTTLREQLSRAVAEKTAVDQSMKQMLAVVEEDERKRAAEQAALLERHAAECTRLNEDVARLSAELEGQVGALAAADAELAQVREANSSAEQSMAQTIAALEEEVELLGAEKAALAEAHVVELAGLRSRFKRTSAESVSQEPPLQKGAGSPSATTIREVVAEQQPGSGSTASPVSATPPPAPVADSVPAGAPADISPSKRSPGAVDAGEDELFADVASDTMFHLSGRLKGIEVGADDTLVELHQSINTLPVAAAGYPAQKCSAFVCALNRSGTIRVYIALYLTESRAAQVYVTAGGKKTPPWEEALREAVLFTETIGFMMDRVESGTAPADYEPILAAIPVFIL